MNIHPYQSTPHWDSYISAVEDNHFELTLRLKVHLIRIEPTDHFGDNATWVKGDGTVIDHKGRTFQLRSWNDGDAPNWEKYTCEFPGLVERNWGNRFVLIPNKGWYTAQRGAAPIPSLIKCNLSLQMVESPVLRPHFTFRCLRPVITTVRFNSYVIFERRAGILTHRALEYRWIDGQKDLTKVDNQQHRIDYGQIPVVHEFGHVLGLGHINGTSNNLNAYGDTLEKRINIMGMGSRFEDIQSQPWLATLGRHLIPENQYDRGVKFTGHVNGLQLATYYDNDWDMKPNPSPTSPKSGNGTSSAATGVQHSLAPDSSAVKGPAGVTWKHMANVLTN